MIDRFINGFLKNPWAWIFFILFLIAEHGNYRLGKELDQVCELSGPHDVAYGSPRTDREELDTLCVERRSDD